MSALPESTKNSSEKATEEEEKEVTAAESPKGGATDMTALQQQKKSQGLKNRAVIGTFDSSAFHFSFKNGSDPLSISLWPTFGFPKIPLIATYRQNFEPIVPLVLIELELKEKTVSNLPKSVRDALNGVIEKSKNGDKNEATNDEEKLVKDENENEQKKQNSKGDEKQTQNTPLTWSNIDFFFEVHGCPKSQTCQHSKCDNKNESNLMYHTWFYKGVDSLEDDLEAQEVMWMGIFEPCNVFGVHIDDVDAALDRGVPVNVLEKRSVFLNGWGFGPCNAHFARDTEAGFSSFYAIGCTKDFSRCAVSYHVIPNNEDSEMLLKYSVKECKTIYDLRNALEMLCWGDVHTTFNSLTSF